MKASWRFLGIWVLVSVSIPLGTLSAQGPAIPSHRDPAWVDLVSWTVFPPPYVLPLEAVSPSSREPPREESPVPWSTLGALIGAPVGAALGYGVARASEEDCGSGQAKSGRGWNDWCIGEGWGIAVGAVVGFVVGGYLHANRVASRRHRLTIQALSVAPISTASGRLAPGFSISASIRR